MPAENWDVFFKMTTQDENFGELCYWIGKPVTVLYGEIDGLRNMFITCHGPEFIHQCSKWIGQTGAVIG